MEWKVVSGGVGRVSDVEWEGCLRWSGEGV